MMFSIIVQDLDVVATDIAAGLLLIQMEQKNKPKRLRSELLTNQHPPSSAVTSRGENGGQELLIDVPATIDSINGEYVNNSNIIIVCIII
jgi:hypothetical protein